MVYMKFNYSIFIRIYIKKKCIHESRLNSVLIMTTVMILDETKLCIIILNLLKPKVTFNNIT